MNPNTIANADLLSGLMSAKFNEPGSFVARDIFKPYGVKKRNGYIGVRTAKNMRANDITGADGARSVYLHPNDIERMSYALALKKFHTDIRWEQLEGADDAIDPAEEFVDAANMIAEQHAIALEAAFVTKCAAANFGTGASGNSSASWGALSGLVPNASAKAFSDIDATLEAGRTLIGKRFDSLFFTAEAWSLFCRNAEVTGYIKTTLPGMPGIGQIETIKAVFGLRQIVIGGAVKNTANDGPAEGFTGTSLYAAAAANHFVLAFNGEPPSKRCKGFGYFLYLDRPVTPPSGGPNPGIKTVTGDDYLGSGASIKTTFEHKQDPESTIVYGASRWALTFGAVDAASTGKAIGGYRLDIQLT